MRSRLTCSDAVYLRRITTHEAHELSPGHRVAPVSLHQRGGLFLLVVGASIMAGAFARRFFWKSFIAFSR
jgi:hypothetical protein